MPTAKVRNGGRRWPGNQNPRQGYYYPRIPSWSCYGAPTICALVPGERIASTLQITALDKNQKPKASRNVAGHGHVLLTAQCLPTAAEVTSMAPSAAPTRTGVRIHRRCCIHSRCRIHRGCCIDRIFLNHHRRRRYNDRPANHEGLGKDGTPRQRHAAQAGTRTGKLLAHSSELRYRALPANRRPLPARQELVHLLHSRSLYASTLLPCLSPCSVANAGTYC